MPRAHSRVVAVAAVAAVVALAGCGGSSSTTPKDPKGELSASVTNLSDSDVLTTTLKLEATAAELQALAKSGKNPTTLTAGDAQALAGASLVIETKTTNGKKLSELKPGDSKATNVSIRGVDNGRTLAELRVINGNLYLQGDLRTILGLAHKAKAYAEVKARAATLPKFIQAFVAGNWVSINGDAAKGLASQFGVNANQSPSASQSQQLIKDFKNIVNRDVTVTRAGSDSRGDHLRLSGNTRALAQDFMAAIESNVPGGGAIGQQLKPKDVPSRTVTVDAWVKDGTLSEIALDFVQFAKPGEAPAGAHLPVALTFEQSGDDISTPSGVTPVDLSQLGTLLGALGGSH
jgi:hypothetical protein